MKNHYPNNFHKNHHTNITRINIFVAINQINKYKAKTYNQCMYTLIIIKKSYNDIKTFCSSHKYKKKFCLLEIRMINLSFNELKLLAQYRNISDYENKPKDDLIKAISKPKPKLGIKKNKLKEIKKDFYNIRHTFSQKEVDKYREVFCNIKNYRNLSESEIEEIRKKFNEL